MTASFRPELAGERSGGGREQSPPAAVDEASGGSTAERYPSLTLAERVARTPRSQIWWGGGKLLWERDRIGIALARAEDGESIVAVVQASREEPTQAYNLLLTKCAPDDTTGIAIDCQNIAARLVELEAGGWTVCSCTYVFMGGQWCVVMHPETGEKQWEAPREVIKGRHARRRLRSFCGSLGQIADSPFDATSARHAEQVAALSALLEERGRDRLAHLAMVLDPELTALQAVKRAERAQQLLDDGRADNATAALEACTA